MHGSKEGIGLLESRHVHAIQALASRRLLHLSDVAPLPIPSFLSLICIILTEGQTTHSLHPGLHP